jgi:hypothetical protein
MLYDCIVRGKWLRVLHAIAEITRNKLEDLGVIFPRFKISDWHIMDERFEDHFVSEWPDFTCKTYIGPHLLLQYDPVSDDSSDSDDSHSAPSQVKGGIGGQEYERGKKDLGDEDGEIEKDEDGEEGKEAKYEDQESEFENEEDDG